MLQERACWCGCDSLEEVASVPFQDVFNLPIYSHRLGQCTHCGSILAMDSVGESALSSYYAHLELYSQYADDAYEKLANRNKSERQVALTTPFIGPDSRVLDVGCATGLTLSLYRKLVARVTGVELSLSSRIYARDHFEIEPVNCSVYDLPMRFSEGEFDFVSLSHVLEHLYEPRDALSAIYHVLKEAGKLYIEVPDIEGYIQAATTPYEHLTLEHVNYFSKRSLKQLSEACGFETLLLTTLASEDTKPHYPVIAFVGRKLVDQITKPDPFSFSNLDRSALEHYWRISAAQVAKVNQRLAELVASQAPVVIWCAGFFTSRLLVTTNAARLNIVQIVDSATSRQGAVMHGLTIEAPECIRKDVKHVLVSSQAFIKDISDTLERDHPEKEVITLRLGGLPPF